MLEHGEGLETWAILHQLQLGCTVAAERLATHRKFYLGYEGPISGERGEVSRWDFGAFTCETWRPDVIEVVLSGECLQGRALLIPTNNAPGWSISLTVASPDGRD